MKINLFSRLLILFLFVCNHIKSQCISTFPALETFEAAPVWTINGVNSDWAWGTPNHPTINSAGGGTKSWCVGGLTGSFYNYSELAWIQSPCYNLSTLSYPWVSFKIFWECERQWDGVVLQSSIDGGTTWQNVGAFGDPIDCNTANWFNYGNITWITSIPVKHGWTGRIGTTAGSCTGGFGSGGWVTAKHCLTGLAGQSNVIFRFLMGSGTTCNGYDGLAFDDFQVSNGATHAPDFSVTCIGAGNFNFTAITPSCPVTNSYTWNFGDPGSGASNTSTLANPTHTFSASGIFTISLTTAGGGCNPPGTIAHTLNVSNIGNAVVSQSINCFGGTGNTSVAVISGPTPNGYTWTPSGGNSQTSGNITAGNYSVSVSDGNGCVYVRTVTITQPTLLTVAASSSSVLCNGGTNGSATVTPSGGTPVYTYSWTPSGGTSSVATGFAAGSYTATITDNKGCTTTTVVNITQPTSITVVASSSNVSCNGGNNGSTTVAPSGGTPGYTYSWTPSGGTSSVITGLTAGNYTVMITDINGCTVTSVANIGIGNGVTLTVNNPTICNGQSAVLSAGGASTYTWSNGSISPSITVSPGVTSSYSVIGSIGSCTATISTSVSVNPTPTLTTSGSPTICAGQSLSMNVSGAQNYTWMPGNVSGNSLIVSPSSTQTYSVTGINAFGCMDFAMLTVTVTPLPTVSVNSPTLCSGETATLTVSGAGSYTLDPGTVTASPFTITPASSSSYTITGANGACSSTIGANVTIIPSVTLSAPGVTVCSGQSATLTASGAINYTWSGVAGTSSYVISPAGNSSLVVSGDNGFCSKTTTVIVTVNELPTVTVSSPTTCAGEPLYLNSDGASAYSWTGPGNFTSSLQNFTIMNSTSAMSGMYIVTGTSTKGCSISNTVNVSIDKCVCPVFIPEGFSPNADGAHDFFRISCIDDRQTNLEIFNRWGNLVYKSNDYKNDWDGKSNAGMPAIGEELPSGTYYYIVKFSDEEKARTGFVTLWR